jgi:hypothetical protein
MVSICVMFGPHLGVLEFGVAVAHPTAGFMHPDQARLVIVGWSRFVLTG